MKTKPTQKRFAQWLRKQPAKREFDYCDPNQCLIASFLRETKLVPGARVGGWSYNDAENLHHPFPNWMRRIAKVAVNCAFVFTIKEFKQQYRNSATQL